MKKLYFSFLILILNFSFLILNFHSAHAYLKAKVVTVIYGEEKIGAFNQPQSVYFDEKRGRLYVVDTLNNRLISYDKNYKFLSQFNAEGRLKVPVSMLKDKNGHLIVTNKGEGGVLIIYLKEKLIKTIDFKGIFPRPVPSYLALDEDGRLYILDQAYKRILIFSPKNGDYKFLKAIKEPKCAGFSDIKIFDRHIYALDSLLAKVFVYDQEGRLVRSIALRSLRFPVSLALDRYGRLYILDGHQGKVFIFKESGEVIGEIGRGGWKEGRLYYPRYLLFDKENRLYVVDTGNNRVQVFKIK